MKLFIDAAKDQVVPHFQMLMLKTRPSVAVSGFGEIIRVKDTR